MRSYDYATSDLPIHKAAIADDWDSVKRIFEQHPQLMTKQILEETPLIIAIGTNHSHRFVKKLVELIVAVGAKDKLFVASCGGNNPLHYAAKVGNTTAARLLVEQNPDMTLVANPYGNMPLTLAAFHGNKETMKYLLTVTPDLVTGDEGDSPYAGAAGGDLITLTLKAGYYAPTIKNIHDVKVNDYHRSLLIKLICQTVIEKVNHDTVWTILGSAVTTAVRYGSYDLIEECILTYPAIITYNVGGFNLFLAAIEHRQERVYNLLYKMYDHKVFASQQLDKEGNETALHIAAKLAPHHRLFVSTGAALQMQRELQWYQEIQNLIEPSYKEALNKEGKTPRMVFTENHNGLYVEGRDWMKNTASSCTLVAALIVTMAFAAAFTVPGGNKNDGIPLFQNNKSFMLFIVSDAVALFSSSTSVLMFLGILTSGFAETDFLQALPKRMTIGLLSLFISIAATMIAFSSVIALVLQGKVTWIGAPLVISESIPVCLFALLQFPLLVELVMSTYGRSIFHRHNARRIR
ncbi:hypothetical protein QVD17_01114 [Tagetes erecta]|uniref:PGG domain-containing protein n=1 Tax=Tagetes erecta TaxID=13708 RepID=A0AAD8L961_TARER|nr:hypothetical protein QVD17_01114 [Tagetes erecta]